MNLNSDIILQGRGVQMDGPMDLQQKAMNLRQIGLQNNQMDRQNRLADKKELEDAEYKNILKKNVEYDSSGAPKVNKMGTLKDLYNLDPRKAEEYNKQIMSQDLDTLKQQTDASYMLANQATPENYSSIVQKYREMGLPNADKIPEQFDPGFVQRWQLAVTSGKERVDNQFRQQELNSKAEDRKVQRDEQRILNGFKLEDRKIKANELNATQSKQSGIYKQGTLAENQYQAATSGKEYDPTGSGQFIDNSNWAPNMFKNDKAIEASSAKDSWIESFLRDASGAAIAPSERQAYAEIYFPQPGDTASVVANKLSLRKQKMETAASAAGIRAQDDLSNFASKQAPKTEYIKKFSDDNFNKMSDSELQLLLKTAKGGK